MITSFTVVGVVSRNSGVTSFSIPGFTSMVMAEEAVSELRKTLTSYSDVTITIVRVN